MGQVSKHHLTPSMQKKVEDLLPLLIADVNNLNNARIIVNELLSSTEKLMIGKRLAIIFLYLDGYTYEQIKEIMRVSAPTIWTTTSNIKNEDSVLREFMLKLIKKRTQDKKRAQESDDADSVLLHPGVNWTSLQKTKHQRHRERQEPL